MDEITIINKTQKALQQRLQDIGDALSKAGETQWKNTDI